ARGHAERRLGAAPRARLGDHPSSAGAGSRRADRRRPSGVAPRGLATSSWDGFVWDAESPPDALPGPSPPMPAAGIPLERPSHRRWYAGGGRAPVRPADDRGRVHRAAAEGRAMTGGFAAMLWKEFIQMRRDRFTLAMMVGIPAIQLILFGYAIRTEVR